MKTEILPQESSRAEAFSLWMSSPMPMVTLVKTLNVSHLLKMRKKSGIKFTSLMCWCIGRAASNIEEFYLLPENGKLFRFDKLVIPRANGWQLCGEILGTVAGGNYKLRSQKN